MPNSIHKSKDTNEIKKSLGVLDILNLIQQLWSHINSRRKIHIYFYLITNLLGTFLEIISISSILPFLSVITNPDLLEGFKYINILMNILNVQKVDDFLLPITSIFCIAAFFSGSLRVFNTWFNAKLSARLGSDISVEFFRRSINQTYTDHINSNSSITISSITNEIGLLLSVLYEVFRLIPCLLLSISILVAIFTLAPFVSIYLTLVLSLTYIFIAKISNHRLYINSKKIAIANRAKIKLIQESLGSIRNIVLEENQDLVVSNYSTLERSLRSVEAQNQFIQLYPRYILESVGLIALAISAFIMTRVSGNSGSVIPILGTFALAAQRLLPNCQQIYASWTVVTYRYQSVVNVLNILNLPIVNRQNYKGIRPFDLKKSIVLKSTYFRYQSDLPYVNTDINLQICKGECIGIVGTTGCGKSTLVDMIMGLLPPTKGSILIDGKDIYDSSNPSLITSWRRSIAHVPQSIYLIDGTIRENIALGKSSKEIDNYLIKQAAKQAMIDEFIESSPLGYETIVGERGVKLSGGQRQRIGIARMLYKKSQVLILDEATSALDDITESNVIESITSKNKMTIIMIAHRLSTLNKCDRILKLDKGKLIEEKNKYI